MDYLHIESLFRQSPKKPRRPCGDVFGCDRGPEATLAILCDGIGSGIKAHLAAEMTVARLRESLDRTGSGHQAFRAVAEEMEQMKLQQDVYPWAALSMACILPDGSATVLAYESPEPLLISAGRASVLPGRRLSGIAGASEYHCVLLPGDGLILLSDGITQAGIGNSLAEGWQSAGVAEFISASACELDGQGLLERILQQARALWPSQAGDDMTAALLEARCGKVVNLLTGPPASASRDAQVVREFLDAQGTHVVCGATTASIVARHTGRSLQVDPDHKSLLAPPKYALAAADLVTEGSVTLNQVYNILDADPADWVDPSGVTELAALLKQADRVNITLGLTANPANAGMHFRQQGLLSRAKIVELLAGKLREMGKLVVVHSV